MNEIRKEIIGLIESYMDKTEVKGYLALGNKGIILEYETEKKFQKKLEKECITRYKRLGHYDITAVISFIINKKYNVSASQSGKTLLIFDIDREHEEIPSYILPNKPLNLYSEQEDKDLLIILNSL